MDDAITSALSDNYKQMVVSAILEATNCIKVTPHSSQAPVMLGTQIRSPIYFDLQQLPSVHDWQEIISLIVRTLRPQGYTKIAGISAGGTFHAPTVGYLLGIEHVCVRPVPDTSGDRSRHVKGQRLRGARTLLMEDVAMTGNTIRWAAGHLQSPEVGAVVSGAISILNFDLAEGRDNLAKAGITLHSLVTLLELVDPMVARGLISPEEAEIIREWHRNPRGYYA